MSWRTETGKAGDWYHRGGGVDRDHPPVTCSSSYQGH